MVTHRVTLSVLLIVALLAPGIILAQPAAPQAAPAPEAQAGAILFVENAGQWPAAARFQAWGSPLGPGTTWLAEDAIWLVVASGKSQVASRELQVRRCSQVHTPTPPANLPPATFHALKLTFPGSNPDVRIEPLDPLTTTVSYFLGSDPAEWRPDVPVYGGVRYAGLYPGVDLVLGEQDIFWRLEAEPGAEATTVRLRVEGSNAATLNEGSLRLSTAACDLNLALPASNIALEVETIDRTGQTATFSVTPGDRQPATHRGGDPLAPADNRADLLHATFLGGSLDDFGSDLSLDAAGRATTSQTLTVHIDVGPVMLTRDGWISRPFYLPLLMRR